MPVADQTNGIDLMRRRMERASRRPPPPRRAAEEPAGAGEGAEAPAAPQAEAIATPTTETPAPARTTRRPGRARAAVPAPARLAPDLPPANLAIRVRRPLDDRLAELIHALRREGVRTSKVELIEMLLWELPEDDPAGARERLRRFRAFAPRGAGAPLAEG
jgi:hypothetical protein